MELFVEGLSSLFILLIVIFLYKLSPSKSVCHSCSESIPISVTRYKGFFNVNGKPEERVVCFKCYDSGLYFYEPTSGHCQKCSEPLEDIRIFIRSFYDVQYVLCDSCLSYFPRVDEVMLRDLLNDDFISMHTTFSSFDSFIESYDGDLETQCDLTTFTFSKFVSDSSRFDSSEEMIFYAEREYMTSLYDKHLSF